MIVFQFHHHIKPEFIEEYRVAILEDARQSVKEPGILSFEVLQDHKDPSHFSLIEVYQDMEAREKHLQTPWFLKFKATVTDNQMFSKQSIGEEFDLIFPV